MNCICTISELKSIDALHFKSIFPEQTSFCAADKKADKVHSITYSCPDTAQSTSSEQKSIHAAGAQSGKEKSIAYSCPDTARLFGFNPALRYTLAASLNAIIIDSTLLRDK